MTREMILKRLAYLKEKYDTKEAIMKNAIEDAYNTYRNVMDTYRGVYNYQVARLEERLTQLDENTETESEPESE